MLVPIWVGVDHRLKAFPSPLASLNQGGTVTIADLDCGRLLPGVFQGSTTRTPISVAVFRNSSLPASSDSLAMKTKIAGASVTECPALEFLKSDHYEPSYATSNAIRFSVALQLKTSFLYLLRETVCSVLFTEYIQPIAPAPASPRAQLHGCKVYWSASL